MTKVFFISEALSAPFDEGAKKLCLSVHKQLEKKRDVLSVTKEGNNIDDLKIKKIGLNKLFLNNNLRKCIKNYSPDIILYIPDASITFNSFIRARILKGMNKASKVVMIGTQNREYSSAQKFLIANLLKPDLLMLHRKTDCDFFLKMGLNVKLLPPAVDRDIFSPPTGEEKKKIRFEFDIPDNKKVVLHVGHIKSNRNIESLVKLQEIEEVQVIIFGSTSTEVDRNVKNNLEKKGIRVFDEFIPDISKVYKMSDIYVFPVASNKGAIDMPLSVLEALACNLPIVTTRFGALEEYFMEDTGFRYFDSSKELIEIVKGVDSAMLENNKKIEPFTWDSFTDEILNGCEETI